MTTPPWGHKPPAVDDFARFWADPPPEQSERLTYWLRRLDEGSWKPNKYLAMLGYWPSSDWLGIYIWEYINILWPKIQEERQRRDGNAA